MIDTVHTGRRWVLIVATGKGGSSSSVCSPLRRSPWEGTVLISRTGDWRSQPSQQCRPSVGPTGCWAPPDSPPPTAMQSPCSSTSIVGAVTGESPQDHEAASVENLVPPGGQIGSDGAEGEVPCADV